jgi:hypothetical protein
MIGVASGAMIIAPITVAVPLAMTPAVAMTPASTSIVQKADCLAPRSKQASEDPRSRGRRCCRHDAILATLGRLRQLVSQERHEGFELDVY